MLYNDEFEKLGYKNIKEESDNDFVIYVKEWINVPFNTAVVFSLKNKEYSVRNVDKKTFRQSEKFIATIDIELNNLIQKQIKEWGWITS
jgi:hypothetical protein